MLNTKLTAGLFGAFFLLPLQADAQLSLTLDVSNDSLQKITGFGAAAMGTLMCPYANNVKSIEKAYGPESAVGLNILRVEVSPSTTPDVTSQWYDSPYDWHGFVPSVKAARKHGAIIYACPWSPPPVFKTNNSSSGGNNDDPTQAVKGKLNEKGYNNFFLWLNNYHKYMASQGAPVDIISLQNEPDWWVSYSGCLYEPNELRDLVKKSAHTFDRSTGVKLMSGEPLGYRPDYAEALLNDPESRQHISYLGGHIYGHTPYMDDNGNYGNMKKSVDVANQYEGIECWMTEISYDPYRDETGKKRMPIWNEQIDFAKQVNEVILAGGTAYVYWYLTQYWSFVGDGEVVEGGDNTKDVVLPRGYIMSHFAKHLPGATRLSSSITGLKEKAAMQRNVYVKGDSIIVMTINGSSKQINLTTNLPAKVISGKAIVSTSNESLCQEEDVNIESPSNSILLTVKPKSITTFILKREPDMIKGDVNGDKVVDVADINAIISAICGSTSGDNADVNGDKVIDVADINAVISIICGQ